MYTINDLSEGRVILKNDNTIKELEEVLEKAFPDCDNTLLGICKYYYKSESDDSSWGSSDFNPLHLPAQSTKDFLQDDQYPKIMYVSLHPFKDVFHKGLKRVVLQETDKGYLAWVNSETFLEAQKENKAFEWPYAKDIEVPQDIPEYTMGELEEKLGHEFKIKR